MKRLTKKVEIILIGFCLHEKLKYPLVRKIFLTQTPEKQKIQLQDMERTMKLKYNNQKAYAQFIKSASNDMVRSGLGSRRKRVN